jgi:hypothetical protein
MSTADSSDDPFSEITAMALPANEGAAPDMDQEELVRVGLAIYERLRPLLEPVHNGEIVAIHVDSGDHVVARTSGAAMRAMRHRQPLGKLVLLTIGPVCDTGLAMRMLGMRPVSGKP